MSFFVAIPKTPDPTMEPRTTLILAMLMTLLAGGVLGVLHSGFSQDVRPSARDWRIGTLLAAAGGILLAVQDALPTGFVLPLANGCVFLALGLYWRAVRRFAGLDDSRWIFLTAGLATIGVYWFSAITPHFGGRQFISCIGWVVTLVAASAVLLRVPARERLLSQSVLAGLFLAVAATAVLRLLVMLPRMTASATLLDPSGWLVSLLIIPLATLPVIGTTVFIAMCSERIRSQWERAASTDHLTNLPNRRMITTTGEQRFKAAQRAKSGLAIAMIDIDHFKKINDQYGHDIGDLVLKQVAAVLQQHCRGVNLVGRLGGEEFAALFEDVSVAAAAAAAERLRHAVEHNPCEWNGVRHGVTVSIGVALVKAADSTFDDALRRADGALYTAKAEGRNRVVIDQEDVDSVTMPNPVMSRVRKVGVGD